MISDARRGHVSPGIYTEEKDVFGINVLDKIKADYILLCEQYEKRSTENFEMKN